MCRPRQKPLSCHFQLVGQEDCPRWSKTQMSSQMKHQQKRLTPFNHLMRAKVACHVDECWQTPRCQPFQPLHRRRWWVRDKSRNIVVLSFPVPADTLWYFTRQKDLSLEKLSMSKAGGGIGLGQGLQNWKLVLSGKQFNSGHPDSTCVDLEFLGLKDAKPDMVLDWEGCRCGDRSHISMHLKGDGSQVCRCQHHF